MRTEDEYEDEDEQEEEEEERRRGEEVTEENLTTTTLTVGNNVIKLPDSFTADDPLRVIFGPFVALGVLLAASRGLLRLVLGHLFCMEGASRGLFHTTVFWRASLFFFSPALIRPAWPLLPH